MNDFKYTLVALRDRQDVAHARSADETKTLCGIEDGLVVIKIKGLPMCGACYAELQRRHKALYGSRVWIQK